jgi:hypothetical protein
MDILSFLANESHDFTVLISNRLFPKKKKKKKKKNKEGESTITLFKQATRNETLSASHHRKPEHSRVWHVLYFDFEK